MSVKSFGASVLQLTKQSLYFALKRYRKLNIYGKLFIWSLILFYICIGVFVIIITPARIAQVMYDLAQKISNLRFGWLALGGTIVAISFPPTIGHTTLVTVCGFAYGMKGFFIAAPASSIGSAIVFVTLRYLFSKRLQQWSTKNEKWQALEAVVAAKGLPLIILIRASPLPPWVYSNTLFASIKAVALWQFAVATLFVYPKILLHVFIGSRIAALSDGGQRKEMSTQAKIFNGFSVAAGILLAFVAAGLVYHLVKKEIRNTEGLPREVDELAEEAIDDIDEGAPLLRDFSSDSIDTTGEEGQRLRSVSP